MSISAVIFDVDGVLVDSAAAHFESWRRLGEELGRTITKDRFRETFGRNNKDIIPLMFDVHAPDQIRRLSDRKEGFYREIIRDKIPGIDGASELVRRCRAEGFRLAIGSSAPPENIELVLRGLRVDQLFEVVVTGQDVTHGKPDPEVFLIAARRLGVAGEECAVVEDAPAGVSAALAAGMTAVALTTYHPPTALEHADLVVGSLRDLTPDAIRGAASRARRRAE